MINLHTTHLFREIHEQPAVLARLFASQRPAAESLAAEIRRRHISHVIIAARGTSDNAARYAQYLLGGHNALPVGLATPSLHTIYATPPRFGNALVLGISQSGKSPDIVAVLAEARRQGVLTAAITNIPASNLAETADFVLDLGAGEERSVAATKTYTSELAAIALLSACLNGSDGHFQALDRIPQQAAAALAGEEHVRQVAERYRYMQSCVTIGRGYNYCTAFELALKMKELTYTVVEPYSSADFLHGPLALIAAGFPVIAITPSGKMLGEMKSFMATAKEREAELLVISDDAEALEMGRAALPLPAGAPEWLSPITAILPGQLLAMSLAHARDYDPDRPRGLRKVTETL